MIPSPSHNIFFSKKNEVSKQTKKIAMDTICISVLFSWSIHSLLSEKELLADPLSTAELVVLVVGILLAVVIVICVSLWRYRERQRQSKAGHVSGWGVNYDTISTFEVSLINVQLTIHLILLYIRLTMKNLIGREHSINSQ